jgi:hypothetical protein
MLRVGDGAIAVHCCPRLAVTLKAPGLRRRNPESVPDPDRNRGRPTKATVDGEWGYRSGQEQESPSPGIELPKLPLLHARTPNLLGQRIALVHMCIVEAREYILIELTGWLPPVA